MLRRVSSQYVDFRFVYIIFVETGSPKTQLIEAAVISTVPAARRPEDRKRQEDRREKMTRFKYRRSTSVSRKSLGLGVRVRIGCA